VLVPPANRLEKLSGDRKGPRGIRADTALRLARYFGTTADFWLNLQKDYELRQARQAAQREIDARVTPMTA
jgi:addiction module HigA family antidote